MRRREFMSLLGTEKWRASNADLRPICQLRAFLLNQLEDELSLTLVSRRL